MTHNAGPTDLTDKQTQALLMAVHPARVQHAEGMSHLEAWDVRRTLTRMFGFGGWDVATLELTCLTEQKTTNKSGKPAWHIVYRAQARLNVRTVDGRPLAAFEDAAMGDAKNFPPHKYGEAHDFAMKTALSQALKRCAVNLGDQLGLSLYRKGTTDPVVGWSVPHMPPASDTPDDPGPGATEPESEGDEDIDLDQAFAPDPKAAKWARDAAQRMPAADAAALGKVEAEAARLYKARQLDPTAARELRAAINARRAELKGTDADAA